MPTRLFASLILVVSLFGLSAGIRSGASRLKLASIKSEAKFTAARSPEFQLRTADEETENFRSKLEELAASSNLPSISYELGKAYLLQSIHLPQPADKLVLYCGALKYFARAAAQSPHNPSYQISWADIQTQLSSVELSCPELFSELFSQSPSIRALDPAQRLAWAIRLAPLNTAGLYLASLVYLRQGNKPTALDLLRRDQEINSSFSEEQRQFAYRLVETGDDLNLALPRRYPQILFWIAHFAYQRESDYLLWKPLFVQALNEALTELEFRFRQGGLAPELFAQYLKNVAKLPLVASTDLVRRRLDSALGDIYEIEGNTKWAELLRRRQALTRLGVLKALIDDKRPESTMLFGWTLDDEPRRTAFDVLGRSFGVYIPQKTMPRLLVLQTDSSSSALTQQSIELMFSENNLDYHQLDIKNSFTEVLVDGRQTIVINLPEEGFRYLKVRFLGSSREPRFTNSYAELLQIYGDNL